MRSPWLRGAALPMGVLAALSACAQDPIGTAVHYDGRDASPPDGATIAPAARDRRVDAATEPQDLVTDDDAGAPVDARAFGDPPDAAPTPSMAADGGPAGPTLVRKTTWTPPPPPPDDLVAWCARGADGGAPAPTRARDAAELAALAGRVRIAGDLVVALRAGEATSDIVDLSPLASVEVVCGDLVVDGLDGLVSVAGLDRLRYVGGDLEIGDAARLPDIAGLDALTHVGGNLTLRDLPSLTYVSGLAALVWVGGDLEIASATSLRRIRGLSSLIEVAGALHLLHLDSLADVHALSELRRIGGDLWIGRDPIYGQYGTRSLRDLGGLEGLARLDGTLRLINNRELSELGALAGLTPGQGIVIQRNRALSSLAAFSHLTDYDGDLHLEADVYDPLELSALSRLTSVGALYVNTDSLTGLEGLRVVYGDFRSVGDCTPLRGLSWVGGDFRSSMAVDACFDDLVAVGGTLSVTSQTPSVEHFPSLAQVDALRLDGPTWTEVAGFPRLRRARRIVFEGTSKLARIDGFPALGELAELVIGAESDASALLHNQDLVSVTLPPIDGMSVRIARNPALTSVSVLGAVSHLASLELIDLPSLGSLDGFSSLQSVGTLALSGATALDGCSVSDLASRLGLTCDGCTSGPTCACLDPTGVISCSSN